jgi:hypothetical protein
VKRVRFWLLCLAFGRRKARYIVRSLSQDPRLPRAKTADIIIRKDGREVRVEADWLRDIARGLPLVARVPQPGERWPETINHHQGCAAERSSQACDCDPIRIINQGSPG